MEPLQLVLFVQKSARIIAFFEQKDRLGLQSEVFNLKFCDLFTNAFELTHQHSL
jgi:hypothetical protein